MPILLPLLFLLIGTAVKVSDTEYQLTKADYNQTGAIWYQQRLDLRYPFTLNAELYLGEFDYGADGMAFVLQAENSDLGGGGSGQGYLGIAPSMDVEFDTWSSGEFRDPPQDHLAFVRHGSAVHSSHGNLGGPYVLPNIEDGQWHAATFAWDPSTQLFSVSFLGNTYPLNYDIVGKLFCGSPYVYWGFTAATGGAYNDQRVRFGSLEQVAEIVISGEATPATCAGANGGVDITVNGGVEPYSYAWSNGVTTEDLAGVEAGTYTVVVTDAYSVNQTATITVEGVTGSAPTVTISSTKALDYPGIAPYTVYAGYAPASQVTLTANVSGGVAPYTYSWSTGATTQAINVSPTTPTEYTVTVTGANGCSATAFLHIMVIHVACGNNGDKVMVCHLPAGGQAKLLCIDAGSIADHLAHGDYLGPCVQAFTTAGAVAEETGIIRESSLVAVPNPSGSAFTLRVEGTSTGRYDIRVLDARGGLVETRSGLQGEQVLQVGSNYRPGVYFVELNAGSTRKQLKLVKLAH